MSIDATGPRRTSTAAPPAHLAPDQLATTPQHRPEADLDGSAARDHLARLDTDPRQRPDDYHELGVLGRHQAQPPDPAGQLPTVRSTGPR